MRGVPSATRKEPCVTSREPSGTKKPRTHRYPPQPRGRRHCHDDDDDDAAAAADDESVGHRIRWPVQYHKLPLRGSSGGAVSSAGTLDDEEEDTTTADTGIRFP